MQILKIDNYQTKFKAFKNEKFACIIGAFDGFHLGHQMLLHELLHETYYKKMVISFENLNKDDYILQSLDLKIKFLEKMEIDYLVLINYNNFKNIFYNEFIKMLKQMNVEKVICGKDFRFGFKQEGDLIDLENNFEIKVVEDYTYRDIKVSSSFIKKMLEYANIEEVNELFNRNYEIDGLVVKGNQIGGTLGYKTANIDYKNYKLPQKGVYFVSVFIDNIKYYGICSIGNNPTLNLQEKTRLEVHILDFEKDIYDKKISVRFIKKIGNIVSFSNKEELIMALDMYKQMARNYMLKLGELNG